MFPVQFRNRLCALLLLLPLFAIADPGDAVVLLPEPAFLKPPVSFPIAGAKRTVLVPAKSSSEGPAPLEPEELEQVSREKLLAATVAYADRLLETMEPEFFRDPNGVIDYAALRSDSPWTASVVFAGGFAPRFAQTLGERLLVVIPNRFEVLVFPALATELEDYAPMIFQAYKATAHPVSVEVFALEAGKLRAVGVLER